MSQRRKKTDWEELKKELPPGTPKPDDSVLVPGSLVSHANSRYVQMAVSEGRAEEDVVRAKMLEHDEQVDEILKKLDDLGVADNTIVIYTTDNGNELMFWPDGGYAPFRGEKGHDLGRRSSRPLLDSLARENPARHGCERYPEPR